MNQLIADGRLALRTWRTSPGFTAIALLSIALGVRANAAIFTLVDQVLLRALPVQNPHDLVQVTFSGSRYGSNWGDGSQLSYPMYTEIRTTVRCSPACLPCSHIRFISAMPAAPNGSRARSCRDCVGHI